MTLDWSRYAEYSPGDPGQARRNHRDYPEFRYLLGGELREPPGQLLKRTPPGIPGKLCWIGLNPSTATHHWDDPTVRRIQSFTLAAGYRRFEIVNLFAYRSPEPKKLAEALDPVGPRNHEHVSEAVHRAARVICAWGTAGWCVGHDRIRAARFEQIRWLYRLLTDPPGVNAACFGFTASGAPRHPLFLRKTAPMLAMTWDWVPDEWRRTG